MPESTPTRMPGTREITVTAVSESPSPRPRGTLLGIAVALFGIGLVAIAAIFLVPVFTGRTPGLALYLTALATPAGLALAVVFALRSGRRA